MRHLVNAFFYSLQGLRSAFRHEDSFRLEVVLALILVPLSFAFEVGAAERALMIASVVFVLIVELLNSAVEAVVDRVSLENHHLAKRAKDMGSAAVFLAIVMVLVIWGLILAK